MNVVQLSSLIKFFCSTSIASSGKKHLRPHTMSSSPVCMLGVDDGHATGMESPIICSDGYQVSNTFAVSVLQIIQSAVLDGYVQKQLNSLGNIRNFRLRAINTQISTSYCKQPLKVLLYNLIKFRLRDMTEMLSVILDCIFQLQIQIPMLHHLDGVTLSKNPSWHYKDIASVFVQVMNHISQRKPCISQFVTNVEENAGQILLYFRLFLLH